MTTNWSALLFGETGSGKTSSIATLLSSNLEVFVIITESTGLESLLDAVERLNVPLSNLHWHVVTPTPISVSVLRTQAEKINAMSFEDLTKIKGDQSKRAMKQWMLVLDQLENFQDERTGKSYGNVGDWGPERVLVIDSLSGLNTMAKDWTVGIKPMMAMGEYGVAMHMIQRLINTCTGFRCSFVLTAHINRTVDPVKGGTVLTLLTLGEKYTPPIPAPFSEVIYAYKDGDKFYWSTATSGVATKNRALPVGDKLVPSFRPLVERGKKRAAQIAQSNPSTERQANV